jgi:hypothetical protein
MTDQVFLHEANSFFVQPAGVEVKNKKQKLKFRYNDRQISSKMQPIPLQFSLAQLQRWSGELKNI